jgi:Ni,Fe-hydrogenase III component G
MAEHYEPNDVNAVLSRIETKIENKAIIDAERWQRMQRWMDIQEKKSNEKDTRLQSLENWKWYLMGIIFAVSAFWKFIWK